MEFFDVNAMIGPCFAPREGGYPSIADLESDMELYGIGKALVFHGLACEYDGMTGNRLLMEEISGNSRLRGAWTAGLHQAGHYPPPDEFLDEFLRSGACAARFFWGDNLSETTVPEPEAHGELWSKLASRGIPAIVAFDGTGTITGRDILGLTPMLKDFPKLPVILSFGRMGVDFGLLYDMLARYRSLHVDACGLMGHRMIEDIAGIAGAGRVLFGSNFPWYKGGQTKIALSYADITEKEKAFIAGANLDRLIGGIRR